MVGQFWKTMARPSMKTWCSRQKYGHGEAMGHGVQVQAQSWGREQMLALWLVQEAWKMMKVDLQSNGIDSMPKIVCLEQALWPESFPWWKVHAVSLPLKESATLSDTGNLPVAVAGSLNCTTCTSRSSNKEAYRVAAYMLFRTCCACTCKDYVCTWYPATQ